MRSSNDDFRAFSSALDEAKAANPHGVYVDSRGVEQLEREGANTFLSADRTAGGTVLPHGDIVGVFKNDQKNKLKRVSGDIIITAIENGGNHLDCYGEKLADTYSQYGFTPVARVKYEYGINPDMDAHVRAEMASGKIKVEPDIYFMVNSGEDAQAVSGKIGTYPAPNYDMDYMSYEDAGEKVKQILAARNKPSDGDNGDANNYAEADGKIPYANEEAEIRAEVISELNSVPEGNYVNEEVALRLGEREIKRTSERVSQTPAPTFDDIVTDEMTPLNPDSPDWDEREPVTRVLTQSTKKAEGLKERFDNSVDFWMRKMVDSGNTINTLAKRVGDKHLYAYYNNAKQGSVSAEYSIGTAQTDLIGNKVGDSLVDVYGSVRAKGDEYTKTFFTFLLHRHNADRMTLSERGFGDNKPVFDDVTALESTVEADELLRQHPEFNELADKVYAYNRNLMQLRVDAGLVSKKQAGLMEKMYPHYVPTNRDISTSGAALARNRAVKINTGIKKATGGSTDILPLDESMARQTMQTWQAARRNIFGNRLLDTALKNKKSVTDLIHAVDASEDFYDVDTMDAPELDNMFTVFRNGKPYTMQVNDGIFEGVQALAYVPDESGKFIKGLTRANTIYKKLITSYSPFFTVKNFVRDLQDAGLYSQDLAAFAKNYPRAWREIATNGELWQQYQALGGTASSVFDYDKGIMTESNWAGAKIADKVETLNMMVEQAPRFAEFISLADKGDGSYDSLMNAMLGAADVTVNFGRSGTVGKKLNSTAVPFLNPSIQGASKTIRTFFSKKGGKQWISLIIKCAALGILPQIINGLIYEDDRDYEEMTDFNKDANYVFKMDDGTWIKIPKGRVLSVFASTTRRTGEFIDGNKEAFEGFGKYAVDQIGPQNPLTSNFFAPIANAASNKTWYGGQIENQRLQNYEPGQRYDESTDIISKTIGGALDISPKKINYVLDAYTGVAGDVLLPLLTPKAEQNPLEKAFTIDTTLSNKLSDEFYELYDEAKYKKNSDGATPIDGAAYKFLAERSSEASDIFNQIRAVENSDLSDKEKRAEVRELREQTNEIFRISAAEVDKYVAQYEDVYGEGISDMENNRAYASLSEKAREKASDDLDKIATALAGEAVGEPIEEKWIIRAVDLNEKHSVSYGDYSTLYGVFSQYEGKSAADKKREALLGYNGLTAAQKNAADSAMLKGGEESTVDYTNKETFIISQMSDSAQYRWSLAKQWGLSARQYEKYYKAYTQTGVPSYEKGVQRLVSAGMSEAQAKYFIKRIYNGVETVSGGNKTPERKAAARAWGISDVQFDKYWEAYSTYGTKEDKIAALMKSGMTKEQAEYFYKLMKKS